MGQKGPIPKRSEDRIRRNKPENPATIVALPSVPVVAPPPASWWADDVKALYKSLGESGMAGFYEPSDWAFAYLLCSEMTRYLDNPRQNGQVLATLLSGLTGLGVTEGDRRRIGIELSRGKGEAANEALAMKASEDKWHKRFSNG